MTDNEIIKALKKHSMDLCSNCKVEKATLCNNCISEIERNALDLINRQQAEIEKLKAEEEKYPFKCVMPFNSMVCSKSIEDYDRFVGDIGADAIKEFAERLREKAYLTDRKVYAVLRDDIDNLVKEMVGDTE